MERLSAGQQSGFAVRFDVSAPAGIAATETVFNLWLLRFHLSTQSLYRLWNRPFKLAKSVLAPSRNVPFPAEGRLRKWAREWDG